MAEQKITTHYTPNTPGKQKITTTYTPVKEEAQTEEQVAKRTELAEQRESRIEQNKETHAERNTTFQRIKSGITKTAKAAPGFIKGQIRQSATDFFRPNAPTTTRARRQSSRQEQIRSTGDSGFTSDFWARQPTPKKETGRRPPTRLLDSAFGIPQNSYLMRNPQKKKKKGRKQRPAQNSPRDPFDLLL